jgi:WD40 repeat protein
MGTTAAVGVANVLRFDPKHRRLLVAVSSPAVTGWALGQEGRPLSVPENSKRYTTGELLLFDLESREDVSIELKGHTQVINDADFAPDGQHVVSGSSDNSAQIWSIERPREPIKISHAASVWSVAWSRDGKSICTATVDGDVFIRDAQTGSPLGDKLESGQRVAFPTVRFLPDGDRLLVIGRLGPLQLWNLKTRKSLVVQAGGRSSWSGMIFRAAVSPDGRLFALGRGSGTIELFETTSLKKVHAFEGHWGSIQDLAFAPNSPTLVSASRDHTLKFWDARRWTETTAPAGEKP